MRFYFDDWTYDTKKKSVYKAFVGYDTPTTYQYKVRGDEDMFYIELINAAMIAGEERGLQKVKNVLKIK